MKMRYKTRGMTLIELMIVIAVLGIVIALGYPSYRDQVIKARRADGMAYLLDIADREERHYSDTGAYTTTITDLGYADDLSPEGEHYKATISSTDTSMLYTISVAPQGAQAKDTRCGTFTLTSLGVKSISGSASVDDCWK
jgi:type IV pilus assembly protein PilE